MKKLLAFAACLPLLTVVACGKNETATRPVAPPPRVVTPKKEVLPMPKEAPIAPVAQNPLITPSTDPASNPNLPVPIELRKSQSGQPLSE